MSAPKHTPGPWDVRYDYMVQAKSFEDGRLVPVAQPYGVNCNGTDLFANARLIAAAPDLLEVAKSILVDDLLPYLPAEYIAKVRAAIAKAEGK
jgi:hypothetical protein